METNIERELGTGWLFRHAFDDVKRLARAELLHAQAELQEELRDSKVALLLLGTGAVLAVAALAVLLVTLGLALPWEPVLGVGVVGGAVLLLGALAAFFGYRRLPKEPMRHTRARLRDDVALAKETLS